MKLKSYFAESVDEAINQARTELGTDAMLISSSETSRGLKDLGRYEVVFGLPPADKATLHRPDGKSDVARGSTFGKNPVLQELAELRKQVESFGQSIARAGLTRASEQLRPEMEHVLNRLLNAGFSNELAHELTEAVASRCQPQSDKSHRMIRDHRELFARDLQNAVLDEEIASRFEVASVLGESIEEPAAVLFVGPPGAGKTSSLMKLGFQFGLRPRRPLQLLSLDTLRIGGCEQLSMYARIGDIGFKALRDASLLSAAVSRPFGNGLILIDTPGFSKNDEEEADALARVTCDLPIEVQLVLPAYMSLSAAQECWRRFAKFNPQKLIVTNVDALSQAAPLIEFAIRSGLPLSFLGTGQQVPEDIRAAEKSELIEALAPRELAISVAV
jgi:flagellar biosynthesis protein FlhF